MTWVDDDARQRDQARLRASVGVLVVVILTVVAGLIWAGNQTAPDDSTTTPEPGVASPGAQAEPAAPPAGWDLAAQQELATRPLPLLPDREALPQALSAAPATQPIAVPPPTRRGPLVAEGFPGSPEGAVGQLAALLEVGLRDAHPDTWAQAYRSVALPGAPEPGVGPMGRDIATLYAMAVTTASDPTPLSSRWQLAGAFVKGETDGGRFVVACVLGEMQAVKVASASAGTADCQALRWTGADWRISPGPAAARAPRAWPGSEAAVRAGYRPIAGAVR